ncbi:hypothetical protein CPT_Pookie8 [Bacillus phage Pookie]|uniref:Uncharacterized protein n=1 Tax=Bacillus phage Pookie TaxID=1540093 RepID=A0A0A0RVG7_9CAUD|nr:hypothetical protein CPT_Pookie8 [Bacillus phage Pookie]AIW03693.1 hypothetical protein CPT_Pookie8 [Bacillus phage Pookie]
MGRWAANGTYVDNTVDVADIQSSGLVPTEEQAKYTPQEKTLSALTVNAGITTNFTSNAIPMDGFTKLGAGVSSTSHSFTAALLASPDGTTLIGDPAVSKSSTSTSKHLVGEMALNFAVIQITNNDAASKTYDVWTRKFNG